jgi:hypothetical protein
MAVTIGVCLFLAGVLAIVGYVNYRAWVAPYGPVFPVAEKPFIPAGRLQTPPMDVYSVKEGTVQKPPAEPSEANIRQWRKLMENNPFQAPANAPRRHTSDELLRAIDTAFAEPAVELKPAVVFFPVVDGAEKVRPDGSCRRLYAAPPTGP